MRQAIRNFLNLFLFWLFSFLLHRIVFVLYHIVKKQDFNFIDFGFMSNISKTMSDINNGKQKSNKYIIKNNNTTNRLLLSVTLLLSINIF